jgi:very-short-patch-repair endonuclease
LPDPSLRHPVTRNQSVATTKLAIAKSLRRRMTPQERRLWMALRRSSTGLHFRRQQVIGDSVVEFYCDSARLAIELDSPSHAFREKRDLRRDAALRKLGIRVLRIPNQSIERDFDSTVEWIATIASERAAAIRPNP